MNRTREEILGGKVDIEPPADFDDWIWRDERFPYPVWQFRKFEKYHPEPVLAFFKEDHQRKSILNAKEIEVFFNYCKMMIYQKGKPLENPLILEVNRAEATVRFFAGAFYALRYSFWILALSLLVQVSVIQFDEILLQAFSDLNIIGIIGSYRIINIFITGALAFAVSSMKRTILQRYRTFRHREVDFVHDAFYLVNH